MQRLERWIPNRTRGDGWRFLIGAQQFQVMLRVKPSLPNERDHTHHGAGKRTSVPGSSGCSETHSLERVWFQDPLIMIAFTQQSQSGCPAKDSILWNPVDRPKSDVTSQLKKSIVRSNLFSLSNFRSCHRRLIARSRNSGIRLLSWSAIKLQGLVNHSSGQTLGSRIQLVIIMCMSILAFTRRGVARRLCPQIDPTLVNRLSAHIPSSSAFKLLIGEVYANDDSIPDH